MLIHMNKTNDNFVRNDGRRVLKMAKRYFAILTFFQTGDKDFFAIPVAEQKAYMESLGIPRDDIERSYMQYMCNQQVVPVFKRLIFGIASIVILPLLLIIYTIKGFFTKEGVRVEALIENKDMDEVIPVSIQERFALNKNFWKLRASLSIKDWRFVQSIILRGWTEPYFIVRTLINVAYYSDMIRTHRPEAMIAFMEYSYSSSLLTAFCHTYGVKHINCMHGEKIFDMRQSFFHFDECYVWDKHYVQLFLKLHAEPSQFQIEVPPAMTMDIDCPMNRDYFADYKYYLQTYTREELQSILQSMQFAECEGKSVKYRPHPRYSDLKILNQLVPHDRIENPSDVPILDSIANCGSVVGRDSTVLIQAHAAGKPVILDDVTFKKNYELLKDRDYILNSVAGVKCLSEMQ